MRCPARFPPAANKWPVLAVKIKRTDRPMTDRVEVAFEMITR